MLKLSKVLKLHIINRCTGRNSENICSRKKERQDEPQFTTKIVGFLSSSLPLNNIAFCFVSFFLISPHVRLNSKVIMLCFPYIRDNFILSRQVFGFKFFFCTSKHQNAWKYIQLPWRVSREHISCSATCSSA
jgi:hypothetical protein